MSYLLVKNSAERIKVGTIFCLGRNYKEHAKEMQAEVPTKPVVFVKPSTAIIHQGEEIIRPAISKQLHYESEIIVSIGTSGKHIPLAQAGNHIFGYGIGLDMTLRDVQAEAKKKGLPWAVAKGFDTSAPVSEIIPKELIPDPAKLEFECRVNGTMRQHGFSKDMIFSPESIIAYLSSIFSLQAGDLIFTGTPEGVGEANEGDIIEAELFGFAKISHSIKSA